LNWSAGLNLIPAHRLFDLTDRDLLPVEDTGGKRRLDIGLLNLKTVVTS
jgi:hypothetical protein